MEPLQWFQQSPKRTVEEAILAFPRATMWELRKARRDALRTVTQVGGDVEVVSQFVGSDLTPTARAIVRSGALRPLTVKYTEQRPIKPTLKRGDTSALVINDMHGGKDSHDPHAVDLAIQIGQAAGIETLIMNGDMADVHSLSKYTPAADKPLRWAEERELFVSQLAPIIGAFDDAEKIYHMGNHEDRVEKWIDTNARQLQGLFTKTQLLGIDGFDLIYPEHNRTIYGGTLVKHGFNVSGNAGQSVTREVLNAGMSVLMGHVHRAAYVAVTKTSQIIKGEPFWYGIENGCTCSLQADYLIAEQTANWQHACTILTMYPGIPNAIPELVHMQGRHAFFRGHMFTSRIP